MKNQKEKIMKITKLSFFCGAILAASLALASCGSTKFEGNATFAGKVSDQDGDGVEGYEISACGKKLVTDSAGIFYIENVPAGKITVSGSKKGFTSLNEKVKFTDRKDFTNFEVQEISLFYKEIENFVSEKKFSDAKSLLKREKDVNGGDTIFQFYDTLCDFYLTDSIPKKEKLKTKMETLLEQYKAETKSKNMKGAR